MIEQKRNPGSLHQALNSADAPETCPGVYRGREIKEFRNDPPPAFVTPTSDPAPLTEAQGRKIEAAFGQLTLAQHEVRVLVEPLGDEALSTALAKAEKSYAEARAGLEAKIGGPAPEH